MKYVNQDNIDSLVEQKGSVIEYYGSSGELLSMGTDANLGDQSAAKMIRHTNSIDYYIKATGSNNTLFNPRKDSLAQTDRRKRANDSYLFRFIAVTPKCFQSYLSFLRTGKDYLYTQAQMACN